VTKQGEWQIRLGGDEFSDRYHGWCEAVQDRLGKAIFTPWQLDRSDLDVAGCCGAPRGECARACSGVSKTIKTESGPWTRVRNPQPSIEIGAQSSGIPLKEAAWCPEIVCGFLFIGSNVMGCKAAGRGEIVICFRGALAPWYVFG
jgi:hypothetical protein